MYLSNIFNTYSNLKSFHTWWYSILCKPPTNQHVRNAQYCTNQKLKPTKTALNLQNGIDHYKLGLFYVNQSDILKHKKPSFYHSSIT